MSEIEGALSCLRARFGEALTNAQEGVRGDEIHLTVVPEALPALCAYLRDDPTLRFDYPADLTARDTGEAIILWYRLFSMRHGYTAIVKVFLPHDRPAVASVTPVWPGMNWHERECYDLFGVEFSGHPDAAGGPAQMRILLPEDWEGHPFRKDYTPVFCGDPLHGPQERN